MAIDWSFLELVESKENTAYVPMQDGKPIQESGVTIGTGVDLGQQSEEKFRKLGIPEDIIKKLSPYFKKKKDKAVKALEEYGAVTLTDDEVFAIDKAIKQDTLKETKRWYNKTNTVGQDWSDLNDRQQTAILSVRYNHGPKGAPNFYRQVTSGDWSAAIENLRNFYKDKDNELWERRVKEAQFLAGLPLEQIDGIDGPITAEAVDKFKNTVGVSTPDRVRPEEPQIGSVRYLDNVMSMVRTKLSTPSEEATEASKMDRLMKMTQEAMYQNKAIQIGERKLKQTYDEVVAEEKEGKKFSEEDEKKIQQLMEMNKGLGERVVLRETTNPYTGEEEQPEERENDPSKDPIYGIF